mmetsp:Transcript_15530/g.48060  ORF Transcript_15530/g.48060 Transcript_15530/m.48060 type:complete len:271 (+) Transcript_15530:67-879(+)
MLRDGRVVRVGGRLLRREVADGLLLADTIFVITHKHLAFLIIRNAVVFGLLFWVARRRPAFLGRRGRRGHGVGGAVPGPARPRRRAFHGRCGRLGAWRALLHWFRDEATRFVDLVHFPTRFETLLFYSRVVCAGGLFFGYEASNVRFLAGSVYEPGLEPARRRTRVRNTVVFCRPTRSTAPHGRCRPRPLARRRVFFLLLFALRVGVVFRLRNGHVVLVIARVVERAVRRVGLARDGRRPGAIFDEFSSSSSHAASKDRRGVGEAAAGNK